MTQRFQKGAGENVLSYPLDRAQINALEPCDIISPRAGKHHGVTMPPALCNEAGRADALREVLKVREDVRGGVFPMWFMRKYYPDDWGTFPEALPAPLANAHVKFNLPGPLSFDDPFGLARVVHMDNPIDLGSLILGWLIDMGAKPKDAAGVGFDFLSIVPEAMADLAKDVNDALETAFDIKYFYGLPRPEEVAGENMTQYAEGSPAHPTFPAGHGFAAFASIMRFLRDWRLDGEPLPDDVKKSLFDAAFVWSMARTFAGVHFGVDNLTSAPRRSEV